MFDSIKDLVFLLKPQGDSFHYIYVNRAGRKILKVPNSIEGLTIEDVVTNDRVKVLKSHYKKVVQTGKPHSFEEIVIRDNGEQMIGETSLNPIKTDDGRCEYIFAIVRDVTERRKNEFQLKSTKKRLEQNQKRMESLVKHNEDAVYELDLKGNFISMNEVGEQLTGFKEGELIGKSSFNLIIKDDQKEASKNFVNVLSGVTREYEIWIEHKNGNRVLLHVKNIPIVIDGNLEGIYGIATDITKRREMENELDRIKDELQLVWDNSTDGIFLMSQEEKIVSANPSFVKMFGYSQKEINGMLLLPPDDKIRAKDVFDKLRKNKDVKNIEVQRYTKDGRLLHILASYRSINKGNILAVVMYKDITEERQIMKRLEESEQRYRKIVELSPEAIVVLKEMQIMFINHAGLKLLDSHSNNSVINHPITEFTHHGDKEQLEEFLQKLISVDTQHVQEDDTIDIRFVQSNGTVIYTEISAALVEDGGEQVIQVIIRDISERIEHEQQLSYLAYHDPLTGLLNRRAFNDTFEEVMEEAKRQGHMLAVLYIDLDNFKDINDRKGHEIGDALLQQFTKRLEKTIKKDAVLCRVGGDEFLVLLKKIPGKQYVVDMAEQLIQVFQKAYMIKGNKLQVTSSFGISLYPKDGKDPRRLIHHADVALYSAKEERNKYAFFQ